MSKETLYGWGRTSPSVSDVISPATELEIIKDIATAKEFIARGLGRSYGDAAQLGGGIVIDNRDLDGVGVISYDGVVTVGAGTSIDELLSFSIPQGWFVPVTPGTRQVTLGGAVAADVHGKNHHLDGSLGNHVLEMRIITPQGAFTISPTNDGELFWATIGGMGLTGVITTVTLKMLKIETDLVLVDTERYENLDAVMSAMKSGDDAYKYSVAWVDCMTKGSSMGRAILTRGDHAKKSDAPTKKLEGPKPAKLFVPFDAPSGLLNSFTIKAFNELWFRAAPKKKLAQPQSLSAFFHPLDGVRDWNRLYGKRGFVQYQFAVPDSAGETVVKAIERLSTSGVPSFLAVLKRFGPSNNGLLSFPIPGWTLALDLPVGPSALPQVLDDLDEMVLSAGGRIYFAKDARLSHDKVHAMYPRLGEFLSIKDRVDPEHRLVSDLSRRLHIGR